MDRLSKQIETQIQINQELHQKVLQVIKQAQKPLTHTEIIDLTGIKYRILRRILSQLKKDQLIYFHPPRSYFHRLAEASLGDVFTIRLRQSIALPEEEIVIKWEKIKQTWIQNEEMGYSYIAKFEMEIKGIKKYFTIDWCDRTSGEMEIYKTVHPELEIHVHDTNDQVIWLEIKKKLHTHI